MSMTDTTQLHDDVTAHVAVSVDAPMVRAQWHSGGYITLSVGGVMLTMSPESAVTVAASLASVASTAVLNTAMKLVQS
jgi:hypothetical protein